MWFLFGFVTIGLCVWFEFWRRHLSRWKPQGKTAAGFAYYHLCNKGKVKEFYLGIDCPTSANFTIKRQSNLDSFFKWIGIANEFETGDVAFDNSFYLMADNKTFHHSIASSDVFRSSVKSIMGFGLQSQLRPQKIHCRGGRIWVVVKVGSKYKESEITSIACALHKDFDRISKLLADADTLSGSRWSDPFVIKASLLLAISSGLAINGGIQFFRLYFGKLPFTLDYSLIIEDAFAYSLVCVLVFVVIALYWLGRSARTHLVLVELITIGALGIFLSIAIEIRDINMEWDISPSQTYKVDIINKYTSKSGGRRKRTYYHVVVTDWRCDCGSYNFDISRDLYNKIDERRQLTIVQREGHLGYPWISQIIPNQFDW